VATSAKINVKQRIFHNCPSVIPTLIKSSSSDIMSISTHQV